MQCGAKTRTTGAPCKAPARANGRCRKHGGNQKRGIEHHSTTHGLYSKSLPTRLAARYNAALLDGELLSVRREAAILTALVDDTLARFDTGETGQLWTELRDAWTAMLAESGPKKVESLTEIGRLIARGATDSQAAREVRSVILDKTRVAESERKRLVEMHQVITVERLMVLVGALSAAIIAEVPDRDVSARILENIGRTLSAGALEVPASE